MFKLTSKTSLLLLILLGAVFLASVHAHEDSAADNIQENDGDMIQDEEDLLSQKWDCNHDDKVHEEPEIIDVDEENFKDAQEGRLLAGTTFPNMRMYGYYGFLNGASASYRSYLADKLMPPILSYFEAALRVKYPVSGPFKITTNSICGHTTPAVLRNGVSADFVFIFASESASGTWVASTKTCSLAKGTNRPLVGETTINTKLFKDAGSNVLLHEKNMLAIMHELTHTLGFSTSLFARFIDNNGRTYNNYKSTASLDGKSTTIVNFPALTAKVREHFGCSSIKGAYMENYGNYGAVAGSHFERRQFGFEAMTAYLIYQMKFSKFTFAMLESSGWYVPNYSMADEFAWGEGQGCSFLTSSCSSINGKFSELCTSNVRKCTNPRRSGGSCSSDTISEGCKFIHPNNNYDCGNPSAKNYARLPNLQVFGRNTGSKCFEGTLASGASGSSTTFCFKSSCSGSGSNTVLNIQVGTRNVECTAKGNKTVAGYGGSITCPDPQSFCRNFGSGKCARGCMGRGTCNNGICKCFNGFKGEDCALNA